jgi:photosystem II stability/assembly factor-like uncharacterized protein
MKSKFLQIIFLFGFSISAIAQNQDYVQLMNDKNATFEQIQKAFEKFWEGKTPSKGSGYKPFKRYEDFARKRINTLTGKFENQTSSVVEYEKYFGSKSLSKTTTIQNQWTAIQPANVIPSNGGGTGRLNCVTVHPNNPNIIFVGSVGGGIWRSYDGGQTWTSNTDQFGSMAISDIAFNPKNPNIVYAATGDIEGAILPHYSVGILKSIDGGITWSATGVVYAPSQMKAMGKILIHPNNPDTVLAAGIDGIYKTYNGGTSWTLKQPGVIKDMEFKPGDPNIIYASYTSVLKSTNNGESFSTVPGIASPSRIALAVTPANPNYVYALAGNASHRLQGIYRSANSGASFTLMASSPDVMNNTPFGTNGPGLLYGQSWYDIAITASPTNADEIYTGGINVWKSLNGGQTLFPVSHWRGDSALPQVHSDVHDLRFNSNGDLLNANDGGLFKTSDGGLTWSDISSGLATAQIYRLNTSQLDTIGLTISGWQDNGTNLYKHSVSAKHIFNQDGMDCQINQTNNNIMYCGVQQGGIARTMNGGVSAGFVVANNGSGINSQSAWVTPFLLDPLDQNTIYVGKAQVYVSNDTGSTWSQIGSIASTNNIDQLAVYSSPTTKYIYVSKGSLLFVKKGNAAFNSVVLPVNATITDIEVSSNDSNKVWLTFSSYSNQTVFQSKDAGATWTNISAGLPQVPANCIIHQKNTRNLYVGTDIGVFYKDSTSSSWLPFGTGLPNVIVSDIDFQYNQSKVRVSTFGRGLWEIDAFQLPTQIPAASFSVNSQNVCAGQKLIFADTSTNFPTSRTWYFQGGTPSSSNLYNPSVQYNTPGAYSVKLVVSNAIGIDSLTIQNYINVAPSPTIVADSSSILKCKYNDTVLIHVNGGINYTWSPLSGIQQISNGVFECFTQNPINYFFKGYGSNGCFNIDTVKINLKIPPTSISISAISGGFKAITTNPLNTSTFQWFLNGIAIPNSNNDTLLTSVLGTYSCVVTIANGCSRTSNPILFSSINPILTNGFIFKVLPNPSAGQFSVSAESKDLIKAIQISDLLGRQVLATKIGSNSLLKTFKLETTGIYFISLINQNDKIISTKKLIID